MNTTIMTTPTTAMRSIDNVHDLLKNTENEKSKVLRMLNAQMQNNSGKNELKLFAGIN